MKVLCAHTELVDLDLLVPNPRNPNKHPDSQIKLLAKIMAHQGWRSPVVVSNRSGFITKGHGRLMAARLNKWTQVPVDRQDYASEADEYADMVADNKIAELSETDLNMVFDDVKAFEGLDFDLLGIPDFKLPEILEPQCDEDEVGELPAEPITKRGDIWTIGRHRLMCGDSTAITDIDRLMAAQKPDMVFTDPPYGMFLDTNYDKMFGSDKKHRKTGDRFEKVKGDNEDFNPDLINTIFAAFPDVPEMFLWGADYYSDLLQKRTDGSWVVWDKRLNENMDKVSGNTFELCWSKAKHKRMIARIMWSGHHGMQSDDTRTRIHPTQKPSKLVEWFFTNWGKDGDRVVDLFGGSGSTLIACEKTGRSCFMMELDPKYCDVIVKRWEAYTGQKASLVNG